MKVKNVLVLNDHAFINGGQAKVAIQSAIALSKSGVNVTFFAPCGPIESSLLEAGVQVICLEQYDLLSNPSRLKSTAQGLWNRQAATALKNIVSDLNPATSIIHCHGFAKALSPAIGPILTAGPVRHVFTMHEFFLACPNGAFFDFQKNEICTRKSLSPSCLTTNCDARHYSHKAWRVMRQLALNSFGQLPRGLRNVIYLSDLQSRVMSPYLASDTNLYHVLNPIDFKSDLRVKAEDNNVALFIGRLTQEKGCLLFAKAAKEAGIQAVFVGEGDQEAAILSENPNAIITGWLASSEVEAWLEKSRYLVFPSLLYETFGLVAYEAFAKGVPVICGQWNTACEIVEDQISGLHVASRSSTDWASALRRLNNDNIVELSKNAQKAYRNVIENNPEHSAALITIYDQILSQ